MNCLQCGLEMKAEIFKNVSTFEGKKVREMNYICKNCDIGFHVMMYNIYHVENNLVLNKNGGTRC